MRFLYTICMAFSVVALSACCATAPLTMSPLSGSDSDGGLPDLPEYTDPSPVGEYIPPAIEVRESELGMPPVDMAELDGWADEVAPVESEEIIEVTPAEPDVVVEEEFIEMAPPTEAYTQAPVVANRGGCNACNQSPCCGTQDKTDWDCCCNPEWPCSYLEIRGEVFPGIGVGINWGHRMSSIMGTATFWEVGASFQDLWEPLTGEGDAGSWFSVRLGLKFEMACDYCERFLPYVRAGVAFMSLDGEVQDIRQNTFNFDEEGEYFGGYVAVGVTMELGRRIRMGPEIGVIGGFGSGDFGWTPQFAWNMVIDF